MVSPAPGLLVRRVATCQKIIYHTGTAVQNPMETCANLRALLLHHGAYNSDMKP